MSVSRPVWGAWIEISINIQDFSGKPSRPVWGAWIEIFPTADPLLVSAAVAPRMGRVD